MWVCCSVKMNSVLFDGVLCVVSVLFVLFVIDDEIVRLSLSLCFIFLVVKNGLNRCGSRLGVILELLLCILIVSVVVDIVIVILIVGVVMLVIVLSVLLSRLISICLRCRFL